MKINANYKYISNEYPKFLTKDEVLDVFVQYIHKYSLYYNVFDIPVGTKYVDYSRYIWDRLKYAFPNISWKLLYKNENVFMCRGEIRT